MNCKLITVSRVERKVTTEYRVPVYSNVCGIDWDTMELNILDMDLLAKKTPMELKAWFDSMHARFV